MTRGETRVAVLVSGGGTNLQALIDAQAAGELNNGRLAAVVSSSADAFALQRAERAGIPCFVIPRGSRPSALSQSQAIRDLLGPLDIDLIVLAGFLHILTDELISAYPNRIINVHPSLIPSFCGAGCYGLRVHRMALDYGVKLTGATVHFVDDKPDAGPVILQKAVPVLQDDTPETLQRRVMEAAEWSILPRAVSLFCEGRLSVLGRTVHIEGGTP